MTIPLGMEIPLGMTIPRLRLTALIVAVGVALVAVVSNDARVVSAQQPLANYSFDTRFELKPGSTPEFDRYWSSVRELAERGGDPYRRIVDGTPDGRFRLVSLPVQRLSEYSGDRRSEEALRSMLGEAETQVILVAFNGAQVARSSFIRQFITPLSVNRDQHARSAATEVMSVTVVEGREREFERVWRRAADAYRRVPGSVFTVARTVAGDGPQFVVTRPLRSGDGDRPFDPVDGVRAAMGERAAAAFAAELRQVVREWKSERVVSLGLDSEPRSGTP